MKRAFVVQGAVLALLLLMFFMIFLPEMLPMSGEAKERFSAAISFRPDRDKTAQLGRADWQAGLAGGAQAFLDEKTGLVYSGRTGLILTDWSQDSWKQAIAYCRSKAPAGQWSLPTEVELEIGKNRGLIELTNDMRRRWLASYIRSDGRFSGPAVRIWGGAAGHIYIMCVARTEKAPPRGFTQRAEAREYGIISP